MNLFFSRPIRQNYLLVWRGIEYFSSFMVEAVSDDEIGNNFIVWNFVLVEIFYASVARQNIIAVVLGEKMSKGCKIKMTLEEEKVKVTNKSQVASTSII